MASLSELERMVDDMRPLLFNEIGEIQDDLKRVIRRLERVPESLLQNGSREGVLKSKTAITHAIEFLTITLKELHRDYPLPGGGHGEKN